ncbi:TetR/AcrR family transcriptional regulator [Sphingomonas sp. LaA6.9]|uniref:TetR/AcrR family transcriptional regulator n=1 Tax=Sphingomonas sp. LaA6.9 TaxID=2919914 RepID=UPI001F500B28|nr:TetR/AcrR family transcriptional regulator [Sphingomonas sp. LaA6.9]MCJ8158292.1 TetR/AcrR family transcriptional regulator [Sphingomonas sp. LaA6.9]
MRSRTQEKRQQIVKTAAELFEERGFGGTSMDAIVQRMGGSKATLYHHFRSKDELLRAVLDFDLTGWTDQRVDEFLDGDDLREGLAALGIAYLTRRLASPAVAHLRMGAAQSPSSMIGREFYQGVLRPAWQRLANRFERLMAEGWLVRADPWTAAMHWKGLNEHDICERQLLGDLSPPDAEDIELIAGNAADAFLKIYGQKADRELRWP